MVGIVGILLLGSLAWSAVGALASAVGSAGAVLTSARASPPTLGPIAAVTPAATLASTATPVAIAATPTSTIVVEVATPQPAATPTPASAGRNPWILLPLPEPGGRVSPGGITIEARGRGDAPISAISLELDGAALAVALEQRSESTWRGVATARVGAGQHSVRATVTDAEGRSGSFRWNFEAKPG